uniref:Hemerythrin-like domain-containing protein n=1 Tax=Erythrolobus australicus TaxID=1077150 RepID=A0A6T5WDH9_9RHOD|mmetsp:Transcript_175/g.445  ORF Transcript_175/g.445 Transcript_175/m.445 type:complete len:310 (+) Transcript_175:952-1881(+)|eukprot:CAMPEP_0185834274 /NCGR_PEP_ID=MMETSP1353-20130828/4925_1 /TAXON_ID=1077150 /ORGANISM="Erythrolobus australicus, Strain CCMP3124" /LENGTH=309 /DNA_ID=CAMNT_0028532679 /DNA_START=885 /DNA_END=1814 /DNA_ORIENTATION=-
MSSRTISDMSSVALKRDDTHLQVSDLSTVSRDSGSDNAPISSFLRGKSRCQAPWLADGLVLDFSLSDPTDGWLSDKPVSLHNGLRCELKAMTRALHGMYLLQENTTDVQLKNFFKWLKDLALVFHTHLEAEDSILFPLVKKRLAENQIARETLPTEEQQVRVSLRLNKLTGLALEFGKAKVSKVKLINEMRKRAAEFIPLALENMLQKERNEYIMAETYMSPDRDGKRLQKQMVMHWTKTLGVYKCCTTGLAICQNWMDAEERENLEQITKEKIRYQVLYTARMKSSDRKRRDLIRELLNVSAQAKYEV